MGVFAVPIKVRNLQDRFLPEAQRGAQLECDALVDSGAIQLSLPGELTETLRLEELGRVRVRTADGALHGYRVMGMVEIEVQGRLWQGRVNELPRGARPLLGAVPLEEMDWHASPAERKLLPNRESPDEPLLPLA